MTPQECRQFGRNLVLPCPGVELGGAQTLTSNTTLTTDSPRVNYLNAAGAPFTITLPGTGSGVYEGYTVYLSENVGSVNAVTVSGAGFLINGAASLLLNGAWRQREIRFNGSAYVIRDGVN
jgi:hypothetical protein